VKKTVIGLTVSVVVIGVIFLVVRFKPKGPVTVQSPVPVGRSTLKEKQPIDAKQDTRIFLEYKRDHLTLQRNIKRAELANLMKDAPCGAKTQGMADLQDEINSIEQQMTEIDRQIHNIDIGNGD